MSNSNACISLPVILDKSHTQGGEAYPDRVVEHTRAMVRTGESVEVWYDEPGCGTQHHHVFRIGDDAIHGHEHRKKGNQICTGRIKAIDAATVTVQPWGYGPSKRLSMSRFILRNRTRDLMLAVTKDSSTVNLSPVESESNMSGLRGIPYEVIDANIAKQQDAFDKSSSLCNRNTAHRADFPREFGESIRLQVQQGRTLSLKQIALLNKLYDQWRAA